MQKTLDNVKKTNYEFLMTLATCNKPIVTVVRGCAIGIGFTMSAHSTFMYCSPDAKFNTPFMKSCQSPEGTSTLLFPQQFGTRLANEILLTDKLVTAKEALAVGFANGIVDKFDPNSDELNPNWFPVIPKLLATDLDTIVNCMRLLNEAKDLKKISEVTSREQEALYNIWMDPNFFPKMVKFMGALKQKRTGKNE